MARPLHGTIAERSRSQLGLITRRQALELGLTDRQLRRAVSHGSLEVIEPGVLRIAGAPPSWEQQLAAGLLGLGPDALVSHLAAASLWRLEGAPKEAPAEFTVPRGHRNRLAVGRVHSTLSLEDDDRGQAGRFRATSPTRTIIDAAGQLTWRALEKMVDGACRDRLTDEARLLDRLITLRRPGRSKLFGVLGADSITRRPHTWLERELLRVLHSAGAPLPRMQTVLRVDGRVARVDAFYEAHRLVVEVAGHRTHSTRRDRQADNERRLALELEGYRVLEFTYEDVTERPDYVVERILARLAVRH
jgi:very-short-patch-repair endonuclease